MNDMLLDVAERSATDVVVKYVRNAIRRGDLLPGQRVRERDLSDGCGVGRSAVREALMMLVAEGTLVREPGHSAVVRRFTLEEVWAHHQIREALEGLAVRLSAARPDQARFHEKLRRIGLRIKAAAEADDKEGFLEANSDFHSALLDMSGNRFIQSHVDLTRASQLRLQSGRFLDRAGMERSHREHEEIILAVLSGDPDFAEAKMREHIRGTRRIFLQMGEAFYSEAEQSESDNQSD